MGVTSAGVATWLEVMTRLRARPLLLPVFLAASAMLAACAATETPTTPFVVPSAPSGHPFIVDESEMSRVLAEAGPGTLVVFDIDNTLLAPFGHLGSDEWYDFLYERGVARGLSKEAAAQKADQEFNLWQDKIGVRPVDPASPDVLVSLRKRGIPYFALTARSAPVRDTTLRQLASTKLAMTEGGFAPGDAAKPGAVGHDVVFKDGVFFVGDGALTKGEALLRILDKSGLNPKRIVFVDDKAKHTRTVDESLTARGIPPLCLRFSRKDGEVKAFRQDMEHAEELATGIPAK